MMKTIYFAGGCFWGTQHYLKQIRGIVATKVGYANGHTSAPTYEEVYTDKTGFAEAVEVAYDAESISLERLVEAYFCAIDPTRLNGQGEDCGTRYRTGIYYTSEQDAGEIRAVYERVAHSYAAELVVEVAPLINFFAAEDYHQDYLDKHPDGYCHIPSRLMAFAREFNR